MQCQPSAARTMERLHHSNTADIFQRSRAESKRRVHDWITLTVTGKYPRFEEEPFDLVRKRFRCKPDFFLIYWILLVHVVSNIFANKCFRLNCWFGILTRTFQRYQFSEEGHFKFSKIEYVQVSRDWTGRRGRVKRFQSFWPVTKAGGGDIRPGSWKISSDLKRSKGSGVGSWERSWESLGSSIQPSTSLSLSIARSSWNSTRIPQILPACECPTSSFPYSKSLHSPRIF